MGLIKILNFFENKIYGGLRPTGGGFLKKNPVPPPPHPWAQFDLSFIESGNYIGSI